MYIILKIISPFKCPQIFAFFWGAFLGNLGKNEEIDSKINVVV